VRTLDIEHRGAGNQAITEKEAPGHRIVSHPELRPVLGHVRQCPQRGLQAEFLDQPHVPRQDGFPDVMSGMRFLFQHAHGKPGAGKDDRRGCPGGPAACDNDVIGLTRHDSLPTFDR
jgi:hypothetical protein